MALLPISTIFSSALSFKICWKPEGEGASLDLRMSAHVLWGRRLLLRRWWQWRLRQTSPRLFSHTVSSAEEGYTPPTAEGTAGHTRRTLSLRQTDHRQHTRPITGKKKKKWMARTWKTWYKPVILSHIKESFFFFFLGIGCAVPVNCCVAAGKEDVWLWLTEVLQKDPGWRQPVLLS